MSLLENESLIKTIYDRLLKSGDPSLLFNSLSDDVSLRLTIAADTPLGDTFKGKEGIGTYFQRLGECLEMGGIDVLEIVPHKNLVIVLGRENGRVLASGKAFDNDFATIFTFRDGKISHILIIEDTTLLTEALRMSSARAGAHSS